MPFSRNAASIATIQTLTFFRPGSAAVDAALSSCLSFQRRKTDTTTSTSTMAFAVVMRSR